MDATKDRRRSPRLYVTLPTTYHVLPAKQLDMPKKLAEVYERVHPSSENAGENHQGMVRDLSANGAFVTGPTVPLLSRILLKFPLPGMANIEAIGWVLWRRREDCTIERQVPGQSETEPVTLRAGFGVLFEALPSQARRHIHRLARMNTATNNLKKLQRAPAPTSSPPPPPPPGQQESEPAPASGGPPEPKPEPESKPEPEPRPGPEPKPESEHPPQPEQ